MEVKAGGKVQDGEGREVAAGKGVAPAAMGM